jgi:hypothetical protein
MSETTTQGRRAFLVGLRSDGSPTCHPMTAGGADGEVRFNTYRKSAKAQNFLRDPRVAVVLLDDWTDPPSAAVVMAGALEPTGGPMPSPEGLSAVDLANLAHARKGLIEGKRMVFRLRSDR